MDSDWGGDVDHRKSTSGYVYTFAEQSLGDQRSKVQLPSPQQKLVCSVCLSNKRSNMDKSNTRIRFELRQSIVYKIGLLQFAQKTCQALVLA